MKLRFWLALWAGKLTSIVLKALGKKGTTLPGYIARKIYPPLLGLLASSFPDGAVLITGTNGKTTTNNILAAIFQTAGKKVAYNKEGSNMLQGITGALLQNTSWGGKNQADLLLLEVDEGTVPALCKQLTPRLAVVTNFFRDQLDRYGELNTTVRLVKESLPAGTELILNADDPLVAQIGTARLNVYYYGSRNLPISSSEGREAREGRYCSHCGKELIYSLFHYGQLGIYECLGCGFKRPSPHLEVRDVSEDETGISFWLDQEYRIPLQGYYNLYNALAAFCAAERLGVAREDIRLGLENYVSVQGRMEQLSLPGFKLTLNLIKNPTGFNQAITTLAGLNKPLCLLIAINDLAADGRDISWLWDVELETLCGREDKITKVICSGLRAEDMAVRLKYAGLKPEKLLVEQSLPKAVELLEGFQPSSEQAVYILSNYTALFPLRDILIAKSRAVNPKEAANA
jgi:UDP-N-acetylmuramyl tripeptide synthase